MSYDNASPTTTTNQNADAKVMLQNQIPYTTGVRHHLVLYHPIVWWRVTFMKKRIIHWNTYDKLLLCMMSVGTFASRLFLPQSQTQNDNNQLISKSNVLLTSSLRFWETICLPLYVYVWYKSSRTVWNIIKSIMEVQQSRMIAHSDAYQCLYERLIQQQQPNNNNCHHQQQQQTNQSPHSHRAYRTYAYDVYLPPWDVVESKEFEFILFLPGAFVEHVAYSQPAALLSDHGYIVIVMSSEPLGIVDMHLPQFSVSNIQRIQQEIEMKYVKQHNTTTRSVNNNQCRWILMGHSMGSLTCTKLITFFPNIKQIVLWGSAPFLDYMGNLSHMTMEDGLRVLVVQGTKDEVIRCYCTPEMTQEYWKRLPSSITTLHEIDDGTHQGFGNYIRLNKYDNEIDCMPVHEQHTIAVQVTVEFLRSTSH